MNFLFHMLLSGTDDQILVGNFMGDFVKGPLLERFPERIRRGITLHRRIDSFARSPFGEIQRTSLASGDTNVRDGALVSTMTGPPPDGALTTASLVRPGCATSDR